MTRARLLLALRLLAALLVLLAALWWSRSPRIVTSNADASTAIIPADSPLAMPSNALPGVEGEVAPSAELIVRNNVFSVTRRPPSIRYQLPREDASAGADPSAFTDPSGSPLPVDVPSTMPTESMPPGTVPSGNVPALYGTMRTEDGMAALLRLDARSTAPQRYQVGDRAGGFRVVRIEEFAVILSGSSGPVTLRLATPAKEVR